MMAESKREIPDTSHGHSQDDGEIPRKKTKKLNDNDSTEPLCVRIQSDDDDSKKTPDTSHDHLQDDIPRKKQNDMDAAELLCVPVKSDEEYSSKAQNLSDDSNTTCKVCDPCGEDGKSLKAEGYCIDCNDFLCIDCFRIHKKPKPLRHHILQDKNSMPQTKSTKTKERQNERQCLKHLGQTVLYYCTIHDSVMCKVCQKFDHRQCQKDGHLIDLNEVVLDTNQLTDIQCRIEALREELENSKTISTQTGDNIDVSYAHVVKEITDIKESDFQMTKDISARCESMLLELVSVGEDLKSLSATEDNMQLFLTLKKAQHSVKTLECKLTHVRYNSNPFQYMFIRADQINKNFGKCGTLMKFPIETATINVKTRTDTTDCSITGIARLSEDKYVVADYNNTKVKLVDLTRKTVTFDLYLNKTPYDVTTIDEEEIAITTLGDHAIILISISDKMKVYKTLTQCYNSRGIICINDNLIVCSGSPNAIRVRRASDGYCKQTVEDKNVWGNVRFGEVRDISHGVDLNILYLTDVTSNTVIRMTLCGEVLASFTHKYLISPRGITCSRDGRVFVCSLDSHMIFVLSPDLSQGQVILGEENGICKPSSIFFSEDKQQLLVGSLCKNTLQIFQM